MGAGAMLLTNRTPGAEYLFADNEDCIYYNNIDDCIDKIRYYAEHEDERLKIAENGYRLVREKHTYESRVAEILEGLNFR
jgi:spore maturation protein CgeB